MYGSYGARHHGNCAIFFTLEQKSIPDLLGALTPCEYDWDPAKWQVLGRLDIKLKDGSRCSVHIYDTYHEFAAFSIGRRYYRGGSNEDLKRLLGALKTEGHDGHDADNRGKSETPSRD